MKKRIINIADLPDPENPGKTYRETNNEMSHKIPIGTLVEVKYTKYYEGDAYEKVHARLWVVKHNRDCDGTPLYVLSSQKIIETAKIWHDLRNGFSEKSLTPVEPKETPQHYCSKVNAVEQGWADDEGFTIDEIRCQEQCFWCK